MGVAKQRLADRGEHSRLDGRPRDVNVANRLDQRLLDGFVAFVDLVGVMFELVAHQPTDTQRVENDLEVTSPIKRVEELEVVVAEISLLEEG
jgi:hypothetical protein